jgi:hypothetical protein
MDTEVTEKTLTNYDGDEIDVTGWNERQLTFAQAATDEGIAFYSYSGRGMYGKTCPGVTVDNLEDGILIAPEIRGKCHDNMGLSICVYLPR